MSMLFELISWKQFSLPKWEECQGNTLKKINSWPVHAEERRQHFPIEDRKCGPEIPFLRFVGQPSAFETSSLHPLLSARLFLLPWTAQGIAIALHPPSSRNN